MTADLLVCPGCRAFVGGHLELRTLEARGDELACACGRSYPIVDGVPIVVADPTAHTRGELAVVIERDLAPGGAAITADDAAADAVVPRLLEHLSIYMDAHWGDHAAPPAGFAMAAIAERLAQLPRVGLAVELGCSVGRGVAELATRADHVVGLDLGFAAVRRARRLLAGERVEYARRVSGRAYAPASAVAGDRALAAGRATLVCADALDPPLVPGVYDRVVALNLIDAVPSPRQLLAVADGLCARGGEIVLSSPYAWQDAIVPPAEQLGGASPAAEVAAILREGRGLGRPYMIEEEAELPWILRRDARTVVTYSIHYIRARKT
jgi:uncharacterized protein YbaR (Trm112 family)/SAM-dependent methyltransferase